MSRRAEWVLLGVLLVAGSLFAVLLSQPLCLALSLSLYAGQWEVRTLLPVPSWLRVADMPWSGARRTRR